MWPVVEWLISLATGATGAATVVYLGKKSLETKLHIEAEKQIEGAKAELQARTQSQVEQLRFEAQKQIESVRAELQARTQSQVEQLRSELSAKNDVIRHELQKQMLRAQLATTRTQDVYSQLIKLVQRTDGAVCRLWSGEMVDTFEKYSTEDINRVLKELNMPGEEEREIRAQWKKDRARAIESISKVRRRKKRNEARGLLVETKNYLMTEGIFMTKPVRDLAFNICEVLGRALGQVETAERDTFGSSDYQRKYDGLCEQAQKEIKLLENAMREDLLPGAIELSRTVQLLSPQ